MSKRVIQANKKMSLIKVFDMVLINSNTKNLNLFRIIWRINVSLYNAYMATINTKLLVKYCGFTFFSFFFSLGFKWLMFYDSGLGILHDSEALILKDGGVSSQFL